MEEEQKRQAEEKKQIEARLRKKMEDKDGKEQQSTAGLIAHE